MSSNPDPAEAERNQKYLLELGQVISNLESLEFALRVALFNKGSKPHNPRSTTINFSTLKVGDVLPENAITDFSTLRELITRYNKEIAQNDLSLTVDHSVVALRDALAHGRVAFSDTAVGNDRFLLKFDKPIQGNVRVTYAEKLTQEWLLEKKLMVSGEIEKVLKAM